MLEVKSRDGRARTGVWTLAGGASATFPGLVFPETSLTQAPPWAQTILSLQPNGTSGKVHLVSGGTWFYPNEAATGASNGQESLVVPPIATAPTSKVQVISVGPELAVFHDAGGWAHNPKSLVPAFIEAKAQATPARLLWAPALGTPADYALWAYLGVDLFDASPLLVAAARGQALTTDGPLPAAEAAQVLGDGTPWDTDRLVAHNLEAARLELERIRHAIAHGTLRALVERRIYASAASVEVLRRFDREHRFLEAAAPHQRTVPLLAMTAEALWTPEVEAFRRTFRDHYGPPRSARVLVLLPCSQRKPYKTSRSHRAMIRVLDDSGIRPLLHEVMITSPLGLVSRELEDVYPANQYDIPVTGHWTRDEEAVVKEQLAALLDKQEYDHVVVHTGQATFDVLRPLLPEHVRHTCLHHPTSREDLARLGAELARLKPLLLAARNEATSVERSSETASDATPIPAAPRGLDQRGAGRDRKLEDLRALATFQFGAEVGEALTAGGRAAGHLPYVKLFAPDGTQYGTTTPDRGVLSLTIDGAAVLARFGRKRVYIEDFHPKKTSSLFAVGVEGADPDVREGDEVVVVRGTPDGPCEVRGCGVAQMSAEEMAHAMRGVAVTLRHTGAPKQATPGAPAASDAAKVAVTMQEVAQ